MSFLSSQFRHDAHFADKFATQYVDQAQLQTVLDTIETSVEPEYRQELDPSPQSQADIVARFRAAPGASRQESYISLLEGCSKHWAVFEVDGTLVAHPMRCRLRACPICAEIRSHKWYTYLSASVKLWTAPKHITLTLRSSDQPLSDQINRLIHCFRRLRQRSLWKSRSPWGYWTLEITFNEVTNQWHPHLHVICNMRFLPVVALQEAWREITGDSHVVKITTVHGDIASYLCKYIAKTSTVYSAPVDPFELNATLKGRRFAQQFGKWPQLTKPIPTSCTFVGTVWQILQRAALGDSYYRAIAKWLCAEHIQAIYQSLKHPPPIPRF